MSSSSKKAPETVVQSLWTKPHGSTLSELKLSSMQWHDRLTALCAWSLSCLLLKEHYPYVELYTDSYGLYLAAELGLPYDRIDGHLDLLYRESPGMWITGKLTTFALQRRPFMHVDLDVFLFKPLPVEFFSGDVGVQSPEFLFGNDVLSFLYAEALDEILKIDDLPPFIYEKEQLLSGPVSFNTGVFYTPQTIQVGDYCAALVRWLAHAGHKLKARCRCMTVDQYLLALLFSAKEWRVNMLLKSTDQQDSAAEALSLGYVHFIADSKKNQVACHSLVSILRDRYPNQYVRVQNLLNKETQ